MTEPNLDQELERLLRATRDGTQPDASARGRVRAALAVGLAGAGVASGAIVTRAGSRSKLWLSSSLAVAVLASVAFWILPPARSPAPARAPALPSPLAPPPKVDSTPAAPETGAPPSASPAPSPAPAAVRPGAAQPGAAAKAEEPADELALVSAMQLALRSGNWSQALALANEHARRFPAGALAQEREGARAIARCQLAEPAARAAIQGAFEARYAGSPYAARVKAACTP